MASVITMPRLSPTMEEGVLAKWVKKEGDKIAPGDVIAEVETDKANMDFPLEDEGVLLKLLVREGETVKLGAPVAILGEVGEDPAEAIKTAASQAPAAAPAPAPPEVAGAPEDQAVSAPTEAPAPVGQGTPKPQLRVEPKPRAPAAAPAPSPAPVPAPAPNGDGDGQRARVRASPLARRIADDRGVDLRAIPGSGPGGRIVKRDVLSATSATSAPAAQPEAPAPRPRVVEPAGPDQVVPASPMRKTIARRLVEAKRDIPHIYLTAEATVDALWELRAQANEIGGFKISINDLVVKAMALALRRVPEANVSWSDAGIVLHQRADIGIAVSLPDGLITPVVRNVDQKTLSALSQEIQELAEKARNRRLQPPEYTGATATVSNLGMYGVRDFVAIINPPESVILAVGAVEKRPMVVEKNGADELVIARRMTLTLSCDHRTVDGVLGARLLGEVVRLLEKPLGLVV